jgi:hypothetical protein
LLACLLACLLLNSRKCGLLVSSLVATSGAPSAPRVAQLSCGRLRAVHQASSDELLSVLAPSPAVLLTHGYVRNKYSFLVQARIVAEAASPRYCDYHRAPAPWLYRLLACLLFNSRSALAGQGAVAVAAARFALICQCNTQCSPPTTTSRLLDVSLVPIWSSSLSWLCHSGPARPRPSTRGASAPPWPPVLSVAGEVASRVGLSQL